MQSKILSNNGIELFCYPNQNQHSFFISLFIRAGNLYEPMDNLGITHFFEHVAIRNINKMMDGRLYNILDSFGLEFNASTFGEMIQFYISGAKEHFNHGAEFITKVLSPIILTKSDIDAERMRIKAEIRENDEKNSISALSLSRVYEGTSLAGSIVGKNRDLDRITLSKLERYREKILTPDKLFFYVTGAVGESDMRFLSELLDGHTLYPTAAPCDNIAPVPIRFGNREGEVFIKNCDYTMLRFNFDLDMTRLSGECLDLLYDILLSGYNSKLFIELSEKRGLFYDTSGGIDRYNNIGNFYFSYELKEHKLYEAIELTLQILASLRVNVLKGEECMRAGFVDNAMMLYDDARELNFTLAYDNHILNMGYTTLEERRERYASVTPEDIRAAAELIFKRENLTLVVKGQRKKIDEAKIRQLIDRYL